MLPKTLQLLHERAWNTLEAIVIQARIIWKLLKKLNIDLPYDPAISLLRIYPKECDSDYYKGTCTVKMPPLLTNGLGKCDIHNGILLSHKKERNVVIHK
jgi:hypothetical protein